MLKYMLFDGVLSWATHAASSLLPGGHAVVLIEKNADALSIEGRIAGLELRDTFLILSSGPRTRFGFLFRKPLEKSTVVEQVLTTGTGALNIDACRIATSENRARLNHARKYGKQGVISYAVQQTTSFVDPGGDGRWPPNILFVHGRACVSRGTKRVPATPPMKRNKAAGFHPKNRIFGTGEGEFHSVGYGDENGLETITNWECEPGCARRVLDEQTGERPATLTGRADPQVQHENPGDNGGASWFGAGNSNVYADWGGASRYYPQFASDEDLQEWFSRLCADPPV